MMGTADTAEPWSIEGEQHNALALLMRDHRDSNAWRGLTEREREFISSMVGAEVCSPLQRRWLNALAYRLGLGAAS
jgi:hypothetical protein